MRFTDLHCDTLYKAVIENKSLNESSYEVSVSRGKEFSCWTQCMAIWIPDDLSAENQMRLYLRAQEHLSQQSKTFNIPVVTNTDEYNNNNHKFIFTVENGAFLAGDLRNIELLRKHNVRMLTLTWNGENCIGGGAKAQYKGLTDFGRACVKELENSNITIDISHASDRLFSDVAEIAAKPLVASHSDSRTLCPNMRNLTDEQFEIIRKSRGLVGLNFHREFLSPASEKASIKDVLLHAEHFLSLGGEDVLCIGSDFDGSDIPSDLNSLDKIPILYEEFLKIGYNEQLVQKIMFYNAHNFFSVF